MSPETNTSPSLDTWLDRNLHRPAARRLANFFSKTPLTPNQITLCSLLPALLSCFFFSKGCLDSALAGLFFFYLWAVMDHADGELARLTKRTSPLGQQLDDVCDNVASILIFSGIFWGLLPFWEPKNQQTLLWIFTGAVVLNTVGSVLLTPLRRGLREKALKEKSPDNTFEQKQKLIDHFTGRDLFYLLNLLVIAAYSWQKAFLFSFVMGILIGGLMVISSGFLVLWFRLLRQGRKG